MKVVTGTPFVLASIAIVVLGVISAPRAAADDDPRIKAYEQQLEQMQRQMDEMRVRLRALEMERGMQPKAAAPVAAAPPVAAPPPAGAAAATAEAAASPATVAEQDRKIGVLAHELEGLKSKIVLPEGRELKSYYGLGPAASKVYGVDRGLSIGGYGQFSYSNLVNDQQGAHDRFDLERFVLYTGYKFTDRIIMNSEIEFEHAVVEGGQSEVEGRESGEAEVEFLSLDFLAWKQLNFRAGLLLVPMGFINEIHEPPYYYGVFRPVVEQVIIPTTWREGGVGVFGTLAPGLDYRAYLMNGLDAKGYAFEGIREGSQEGNRALADDVAGTARLDYAPIPGTTFGASFFAGNAGQHQVFAGQKPNVFTLLWETHAQVQWRGLWLRALGVMTTIHDAAIVSEAKGETIGEDQFGFYAEAAYDLLPLLFPSTTQALAPFFRYEIFDTQDKVPQGFARNPGHNVQLYTVGAQYWPYPQVVLKLDYRNFDAGSVAPIPDEVNLGAGFVF